MVRAAVLISALSFIILASSTLINKHYTRYTKIDGYICYGSNRVFHAEGLDLMTCAINCRLKNSCKSFMFKIEGGDCYGCNRIFATPNENTALLQTEHNAIHLIDTVGYNGVWGTVCDDRWWNFLNGHEVNNVNVLCTSLGFNKGGVVLNQGTYQMAYSDGVPIWLDNVECNGTEPNIAECRHSGLGSHDCSHYEDVGVKCNL